MWVFNEVVSINMDYVEAIHPNADSEGYFIQFAIADGRNLKIRVPSEKVADRFVRDLMSRMVLGEEYLRVDDELFDFLGR